MVERAHGLHEEYGVHGDRHAGLGSVLGVVQADAEDRLRVEGREHLAHRLLLLAEREVAEDVLRREQLHLRGEPGLGVRRGGLADELVPVGVQEAAEDGGGHFLAERVSEYYSASVAGVAVLRSCALDGHTVFTGLRPLSVGRALIV